MTTTITAWSTADLDRIGAAEELQISTRRSDGSLREWLPIWAVRVGSELYVRSFHGTRGAWYRHAAGTGAARIRVAELERDVTVTAADENTVTAVDAAYRGKYASYGDSYLRPMLAPTARAATLRLTPGS